MAVARRLVTGEGFQWGKSTRLRRASNRGGRGCSQGSISAKRELHGICPRARSEERRVASPAGAPEGSSLSGGGQNGFVGVRGSYGRGELGNRAAVSSNLLWRGAMAMAARVLA